MFFVAALVCLLGFLSVASAMIEGVEFYTNNMTAANIDCMAKNGAKFIVPTGMQKYTTFDPKVCDVLQDAKNANIAHRDVHLFPSQASSTGDVQVSNLVKLMKSTCADGLWSGRIWLDISAHEYWENPWHDIGYERNRKFFEQMVDECNKEAADGITCGIYSDSQEWKYIFNDAGYSYAPSLKFPLWYISIDDSTTMNFNAFGGFTKPFGKSYSSKTTGYCGTTSSLKIAEWDQN